MRSWDAARPPVRHPPGVRCQQPRIVRNGVQISSRHRSGNSRFVRSSRQETTGGMSLMQATVGNIGLAPARGLIVPLIALASLALTAQPVAQTYGFATLQPATLNHTTASAVAKVLKEKAGLNVLVQPTAGDQVIVPMVARGEAEIGISNAMEVHDGLEGLQGPAHPSRQRTRCASASSCARQRHPDGRGPQGQARAVWIFRHARPRADGARHPRNRESHREGHQAGSRAQCDPQRRRLSFGCRRRILLRLRRAEGAGGRRHGGRHPHDRDQREGDAEAARSSVGAT